MANPWLEDPDVTLYHGDALETLRELDTESVDCVVTSPPYWGLRDYGQEGQLGLEPTPEQYVERMVEVFREVRRMLASHGTVWLNLGDSYATAPAGNFGANMPKPADGGAYRENKPAMDWGRAGLKQKDLCGIPWRVAFALQADGWYLRSDIIWSKPNPMPESVTDRPTKAHEYLFLLSKQPRYFFDTEAVREPHKEPWRSTGRLENRGTKDVDSGVNGGFGLSGVTPREYNPAGRNIRSVWEIATQPYPEAHFATFPEELARRAIAAGCPEQVCRVCGKARERVVEVSPMEVRPGSQTCSVAGIGGTVTKQREATTTGWTDCECRTRTWEHSTLCTIDPCICKEETKYRPGIALDPFMGSGTVAYVARKLGRHSIGIDLNAEYLELAARRLQQQSLFAGVAS